MQHRIPRRLNSWSLLSALLLSCVLQPCVADSRVYQWTDANGTVHYGDAPKGAAKPVAIRPASGAVKAAVPPVPAEIDAEACTRKRDTLQRYVGAAKVTETNALGETREYDEAQRLKLIEATEADVRATCGEN